jgi:hypothetical protein
VSHIIVASCLFFDSDRPSSVVRADLQTEIEEIIGCPHWPDNGPNPPVSESPVTDWNCDAEMPLHHPNRQ